MGAKSQAAKASGRDAPNGNGTVKRSTVNATTEPSTAASDDAPDTPALRRMYRHTFAVHSTARTSCLSHDSTASPSFLGFRNLMALVLIVSNLRLMIENFKKYGVLICLSCHDYRKQDLVLGGMLYFLVPCHLFVAYIIEQAAAEQARASLKRAKGKSTEKERTGQQKEEIRAINAFWRRIAFAHGLNASLNLAIATYVVYYHIHHPGIGTLCELHAVIVWLKTCSYAFTNRDLRHAMLHPGKDNIPALYESCPYPQNITLGNLCYFWWAPTLIYQPVYPRSAKIRWGFVFKRAIEVVVLSIVIWIASAQYAVPLLQNSLGSMSSLDFVTITERLLKLSTISLFCWLAGFFALFQSALNGLAEIMRFDDREFYGDWWNSSNMRTYWTSWNKPVFQFMKRHIYSPLIARGVPPVVAQIFTFFFSGVLHELLVGVPTHNILGVAFAGMMFQLPLIIITDPLSRMKSINGKLLGNLIFWISFCLVGQPLAALLYFFAWQAKYGSVSQPQLWATTKA